METPRYTVVDVGNVLATTHAVAMRARFATLLLCRSIRDTVAMPLVITYDARPRYLVFRIITSCVLAQLALTPTLVFNARSHFRRSRLFVITYDAILLG